MTSTRASRGAAKPPPKAGGGPIVVLTGGRQGSTLLRMLLDTHPRLACPPETDLVLLVSQLGAAWRQLDQTGEPLSDEARKVLRSMVDAMYTGYLAERGKQRWCDKSLNSARGADTFLEVFPDAQFVCLYRHCLDQVYSLLESNQWSVRAHRMTAVARYGGNLVAAAVEVWCAFTEATLDFEQRHPELCHRLHYEDLVAAPEEQMVALFEFLGEAPVPEVVEAAFTTDHGLPGRSDHKVWTTSRVLSNSVGRGRELPVRTLPPALARRANRLLVQLGYARLREYVEQVAVADETAADFGELVSDVGAEVTDRLAALDPVPERWLQAVVGEPVKLVVRAATGATREAWLVDLAGGDVTGCPADLDDGFSWSVRFHETNLRDVRAGRANLGTSVRSGTVAIRRHGAARTTDPAEVSSVSPNGTRAMNRRTLLLTQLLGYLLGPDPAAP